MTSFLVGLLDFPPRLAVGTTMLVALVLNAAGALSHIALLHVDLRLLVIFGLGSIAGTFFGVRLAARINRTVLTAILAVLTIGSGVFLALRG